MCLEPACDIVRKKKNTTHTLTHSQGRTQWIKCWRHTHAHWHHPWVHIRPLTYAACYAAVALLTQSTCAHDKGTKEEMQIWQMHLCKKHCIVIITDMIITDNWTDFNWTSYFFFYDYSTIITLLFQIFNLKTWSPDSFFCIFTYFLRPWMFLLLSVNVKLCFFSPVPLPWVGHSHPRGQKPDQPDADHQPSQEDHCSGGPQAPMGLRKCPHPPCLRQTSRQDVKWKTENLNSCRPSVFILLLFLLTATIHSGIYDAQTGDRGVPEEIQCEEETQGLFAELTLSHIPHFFFCSNTGGNKDTVISSPSF